MKSSKNPSTFVPSWWQIFKMILPCFKQPGQWFHILDEIYHKTDRKLPLKWACEKYEQQQH